MSTPLATPTELGVYLGQDIATADPRATLILQLAHDLCETIVSPVPTLAKVVELAVAARAHNNVTSAHQMSLGSASVSFGAQNSTMGVGGLYLSKSERATLRRLAGRSGAFSVSMVPAPVPPTAEPVVSSVDPDGAATGDLVRVEGYGFTGTLAVTVGGTDAEWFEVSDTLLHVVIPTGSAGSVDVVVTNEIGASAAYAYERG